MPISSLVGGYLEVGGTGVVDKPAPVAYSGRVHRYGGARVISNLHDVVGLWSGCLRLGKEHFSYINRSDCIGLQGCAVIGSNSSIGGGAEKNEMGLLQGSELVGAVCMLA